jgi:predicted enzyme related to lactoylglutathione lyase
MSEDVPAQPGAPVWHDLTIPNAEDVRDFYAAVFGWQPSPLSMGDYDDYVMVVNEKDAYGICHQRGENANLPPQWLIYVRVADLEASIKEATARGGTVIAGPRGESPNAFYVIRDPAGAHIALMG